MSSLRLGGPNTLVLLVTPHRPARQVQSDLPPHKHALQRMLCQKNLQRPGGNTIRHGRNRTVLLSSERQTSSDLPCLAEVLPFAVTPCNQRRTARPAEKCRPHAKGAKDAKEKIG